MTRGCSLAELKRKFHLMKTALFRRKALATAIGIIIKVDKNKL